MIRAFLTVVLPLLLPTALYLLWAFAMRRAETAGVGDLLRGFPWVWLAGAGVALLAAVLVMAALGFGRGGDTARYVPPRAVDGQIIPGHVEPAPAARP